MPRTEFPDWSSAGLHSAIPSTFGITTRRPPQTPDFAGRPTYRKEKRNKIVFLVNTAQPLWLKIIKHTVKANCPE